MIFMLFLSWQRNYHQYHNQTVAPEIVNETENKDPVFVTSQKEQITYS